jgi:hypothetical protein
MDSDAVAHQSFARTQHTHERQLENVHERIGMCA